MLEGEGPIFKSGTTTLLRRRQNSGQIAKRPELLVFNNFEMRKNAIQIDLKLSSLPSQYSYCVQGTHG